jgi:hypothetical protein
MRAAFIAALMGCGLAASPASALVIRDYFTPDIANAPNAAQVEAVVRKTTTDMAKLYSNPVEVSIVFSSQMALPGDLGDSRGSDYLIYAGDYDYLSALDSLANPKNHPLAQGLNHLATGNAADPSSIMVVGSANLGALGVYVPGGWGADGVFGDGTLDGRIDIDVSRLSFAANPPAYDGTNELWSAQTVIAHEVDEILGVGDGGTNLITLYDLQHGYTFGDPTVDALIAGAYGDLDRFRYAAPGVPSYSLDPSVPAYFSLDGGKTNLADFNTDPGSSMGDLGPTTTPCPAGGYGGPLGRIQDGYNCNNEPTVKLQRGMVEDVMLQSVGYNPTVPEPATWALLLLGAGLTGAQLRARRRAVA